MLTSGWNSKKLPQGFKGYPKVRRIFGCFIYHPPRCDIQFTCFPSHIWISRIFGLFWNFFPSLVFCLIGYLYTIQVTNIHVCQQIFGFQGFLDFSGHFFVHLTFDELGLKILFSSDLRCYIQGLLDIWIFGFNTYQIYDIPDCCHIFGFKDFWIIRKFFVHLTFDELGLRILGYVDFISFLFTSYLMS